MYNIIDTNNSELNQNVFRKKNCYLINNQCKIQFYEYKKESDKSFCIFISSQSCLYCFSQYTLHYIGDFFQLIY